MDDIGPVEPDRDDIRFEPLSLPDNFTWDDIDLLDDDQVLCMYSVHVYL